MSNLISLADLKATLSYDPLTGYFTRLTKAKNSGPIGSVVGCIARGHGYLVIRLRGRNYYGHRLAWFYVHGEWPAVTDHINGVRHDNRIANLRDTTTAVNRQNITDPPRHSRQRYLGVDFDRQLGRYRARIFANGVRHVLGHFASQEAARDAYVAAKAQLHPEASQRSKY